MTTKEDQLVYDLQRIAFDGTPLDDRLDRRILIAQTEALQHNVLLGPMVGPIVVVEEDARRVSSAGRCARDGSWIAYSANRQHHWVMAHEVAHAIHARSHLGGRPHGPEYRAFFVWTVGALHGDHYADTLRSTFEMGGAPVADVMMPPYGQPVHDVDALAAETRRFV